MHKTFSMLCQRAFRRRHILFHQVKKIKGAHIMFDHGKNINLFETGPQFDPQHLLF